MRSQLNLLCNTKVEFKSSQISAIGFSEDRVLEKQVHAQRSVVSSAENGGDIEKSGKIFRTCKSILLNHFHVETKTRNMQ